MGTEHTQTGCKHKGPTSNQVCVQEPSMNTHGGNAISCDVM